MDEPNGGNAPGFEPAVTTEVQVNTTGSEGAAPITPAGEGAPSAEGTEQQPAAQPNASATEEEAGKPDTQGQGKSETPSTDPEKEFQEIIEGWKEDRVALQASENENRTLRDENAQLKNKLARYESGEDEGEDDEFAGLSREERERRIVEKHQKAETEKAERTRQEVAREISFHERTDPEFRANKDAVLKLAASFNCTSLEQAMKFWRAQKAVAERAKKSALKENERKGDAGVTPGGNGGQGNRATGYDPARDGGKSIRDIYAEEGIR